MEMDILTQPFYVIRPIRFFTTAIAMFLVPQGLFPTPAPPSCVTAWTTTAMAQPTRALPASEPAAGAVTIVL